MHSHHGYACSLNRADSTMCPNIRSFLFGSKGALFAGAASSTQITEHVFELFLCVFCKWAGDLEMEGGGKRVEEVKMKEIKMCHAHVPTPND